MSLSLLVMRRFLATTAVIGASLISAAPDALAQCRNGWCRSGCNNDDECNYVTVISRNYPYVIFMNNSPHGMF